MMLEVIVKPASFSFVVELNRFKEIFKKHTSFTTTLRIWKEEVYFETPVRIDIKPDVYRAKQGEVYYWPPASALCIFFGPSHPYTPVISVGKLIGPTSRLRWIEDGYEAEIIAHEISKENAELIELLRKFNYSIATPVEDDRRIVTASKFLGNFRLAFTIYPETYGYCLETDSLFKYSDDLSCISFIQQVLEEVIDKCKFVRLDLNEDKFVVVSIAANNLEELETAIKELETVYLNITNYLTR